ncbi:hypothetical protein NDN08_004850 [Rhodosorus marinus]|uniref:Uncharacterized protein n=1 Tax=Rhodosorus marinus TaxID=101924 RepID=A0AAV8UHH4_9RHOD|nr:hypothetical protein NDN08_004850 [Rhodosorus marinus]
MMRVIILVALSLALLDTAWSAPPTCADALESVFYDSKPLHANLLARNGTMLGTVNLSVVERKESRCFRAVFTVERANVGLRKLRAGIITAGEPLPTGKNRFTKRKLVTAPLNVLRMKMDICPDRIPRGESDSSCCGLLEFFAFAVFNDGGTAVRGYLAPSENTTQNCRIPEKKKPFRYVCTVENFCHNCPSNTCKEDSGTCVTTRTATSKYCPYPQVAVANSVTEACECVTCPETQCIDPVDGLYACIEGASKVKERCADSDIAVLGEDSDGLCECQYPCPPDTCFATVSISGDIINRCVASGTPSTICPNISWVPLRQRNGACFCASGCSNCPEGSVPKLTLPPVDNQTCVCVEA